jgi:hypothetical protein
MESVSFDGSQPAGEVGHYTYSVADDAWTWSDGMYALHGYAPREVPATTAVLLRHKHPEDRSRAHEVLRAAIQDGGTFSCYHRVVGREGRVRSVLSVGRGLPDPNGRVALVEGYLVDLTQVRREETDAEVQVALAGITGHRAVIEQAKGMVMAATGCDAEEAFAHLRRCSQRANVKVNEVAHRLVAAAVGTGGGTGFVLPFLDDLVASSDRSA